MLKVFRLSVIKSNGCLFRQTYKNQLTLVSLAFVEDRFYSTSRIHYAPTNLVEPSFASQGLGLANPYPSGLAQFLLEQVHLLTDLPWWGSIVTTTVILRIALLPLVVKSRKHMVKLQNISPEMSKLHADVQAAKTQEELQERHQIYLKFIQSNNIKWQNTFLPIMGNGIVLSTMFFALRGMANLPVDSMTNGGVLWFTDLTVQDPYFLLPVIAVSSVYINMKLGAEGQSIDSLPPIMKIFFKGVILMSFPIMCHFPTALNVYWVSSNFFTILQARILAIDKVERYFGIEKSKKN